MSRTRTLSCLTLLALTAASHKYDMAKAGGMSPSLAFVHAERHTPIRAIVAVGGVAIAFAGIGDFAMSAAVTRKLFRKGRGRSSRVRHNMSQADLIISSSHGRGGIGRLIFGSVAESVLHGARIPILLVRDSAAPLLPLLGAAEASSASGRWGRS